MGILLPNMGIFKGLKTKGAGSSCFSSRLEQEIHMDRIVGKDDHPVIGLGQYARIEQRSDIAMNGFDIAFNAPPFSTMKKWGTKALRARAAVLPAT